MPLAVILNTTRAVHFTPLDKAAGKRQAEYLAPGSTGRFGS